MAKVLLSVLLFAVVGCAGASSKTSSVPSFDLEDERLFDNGLDEVLAPSIVDAQPDGAFEQRVARADLIALVRIESTNSHVDFEQRTSYLLHTESLSEIRGRLPASLVLRVHDGERGFESIRRSEDDLPGSPWVAFIKWQKVRDGSSELRPRWHLSPNSARVLEKIAFLMHPPPGHAHTEVEVIRP